MSPTTFRACLYFVPLFLTPFVEKLGDIMFKGTWPTWPQIVVCSLIGAINSAVGIRAFYDGSAERAKKPLDFPPVEPKEKQTQL